MLKIEYMDRGHWGTLSKKNVMVIRDDIACSWYRDAHAKYPVFITTHLII